jgi:hypothetical protein
VPSEAGFETQIAVFGTIALATIAWALGICLRSRSWWTLGAVTALIHVAAAFHAFYDWSHASAVVATAQQTGQLTGVFRGEGVFFNYAFLVVWLADAAWWWLSPASHETRTTGVSAAIHGFLFFMFVNGAVVFADGWMRVIGIIAVGTVSLVWSTKLFARKAPAQ